MKINKNLSFKNNFFLKTEIWHKKFKNLIFKPWLNQNKNFFFLIWFFFNFTITSFFTIYKFIDINLKIMPVLPKFLSLFSIKIENFFFFQKWWTFELLLLNKKFKFNLVHLTTKNFLNLFKSYFFNNFLKITIIFNKLNDIFFIKTNFLVNYSIFQKSMVSFFEKLNFIIFNNEIFLKNFFLFNNLKKNFKSLFVDIFSKIQNFDKFYLSFQSFINNNLYLARQTLFLTNISTNSFNFLLLKNFNKIFYWTGDKPKKFPLYNVLFWGKQNIFFSKGQPYYNYNRAGYWNLFILNANYYKFYTNKISFYSINNKDFNFFFDKNFLSKKKLKSFNNRIILNYVF